MVLRGGYGIYYSRPTGQACYQYVLAAPFSLIRINAGRANADATFQAPFPQPFPTPDFISDVSRYSPTTTYDHILRSTQFSAGHGSAVFIECSGRASTRVGCLEVGYVGTRGTHLQRYRSLNQALERLRAIQLEASFRKHLANIPLRVPVPGIRPDSLREMESEGSSWYNGLEASLTKRLSHGLQFLASYTFSKTLDTDGADINSTSSGNALTLGDQNSPRQRWGRASFRPHSSIRFQRDVESSQPVCRTATGCSGRVGCCCNSYDSIWQRSYHRRHECQQRFRDKRRSGATERYMLEKPIGQGRAGRVEIEWLFQCLLFYDSANYRRGWHWNRVWEQRDRDRGRSRASESGSRTFKNGDGQLADREK